MVAWLALVLAASPCVAGERVDVQPRVWRQRLAAALPGGHDPWLAQLHLGPVSKDTWEPPKLVRAEVVAAQLTGASKADLLVQAVFFTRFIGEESRGTLSRDVWLYRVQVLRAEDAHWCAIGDALSADVPLESFNAGPADGMMDTALPVTFSLVHFTHADRHTVEVKRPFDNVSRASSAGAQVEWWDVAGGRLVQVLALTSRTVSCPACEHPFTTTWFELRGRPPVSVVQFTRSCDEPAQKSCALEQQEFMPKWQPVLSE